ncbi:MAG: hypothetical protein WD379_02945 [Dehalococcoidia bacterium]
MKRILAGIFSKRSADATTTVGGDVAGAAAEPRFVLLIRDSSAMGAFQLHAFEDEEAAAEFVKAWIPPSSEHGSLAFWIGDRQAMRLPGSNEERAAEVVVLIRDEDEPDIVYPFSMPDMELAQAWLDEEARRGLDMDLVLVHWAARAQISRDHWGKIHFVPVELPAYRSPEPETGPTEEGTPQPQAAGDAETQPRRPETRSFVPEPRAVSEALRAIARGERPEQRGQQSEQRAQPFEGFGSPPGRF